MTRVDPREDVLLGFVGERLVANSLIEWADTSYGERHFNSLGWCTPSGDAAGSVAPWPSATSIVCRRSRPA